MGQGGIACPRPTPRRILKARRKRQAAKVVKSVRARCVARDGYCRIDAASGGPKGDSAAFDVGPCSGPSEWAHLSEQKRAKTRGQAPEVRHTTAGSLMACKTHHDRYDGRQRPRLGIEATILGADGPLEFIDHAKAHRRIP